MASSRTLFAATIATLLTSSTIAHSTTGETAPTPTPTENTITMGMSTALSGPASKLGINMKAGVEAAFAEANESGGVHDHTIELVALDDGYEPARTAPNMHALIDEHHVTAIIGNVGTPTAVAAIPIANEDNTLLFGAYTGAGALRKDPPDRCIINYRASYAQETGAMVDALINEAGLSVNEIGFFTQRDAYGDAGFNGGIAALKAHGLNDEHTVAHGRYERNTIAVENGLADIMLSDTPVKAVIMVGAYAPCAEFIKVAKEYELDALFLNVSFVGSTPLANELGSDGDGVIITQVVPHFMGDLPIAHNYRAALNAFNPEAEPNFGSFEGYIAGRIMVEAMQNASELPTRSTIVDAFESMGDFDLGLGVPMNLSPSNHQASTTVWPTIIRDGKVVAFTWDQLAPSTKETLSEAESD